jgi:hypothetical protein
MAASMDNDDDNDGGPVLPVLPLFDDDSAPPPTALAGAAGAGASAAADSLQVSESFAGALEARGLLARRQKAEAVLQSVPLSAGAVRGFLRTARLARAAEGAKAPQPSSDALRHARAEDILARVLQRTGMRCAEDGLALLHGGEEARAGAPAAAPPPPLSDAAASAADAALALPAIRAAEHALIKWVRATAYRQKAAKAAAGGAAAAAPGSAADGGVTAAPTGRAAQAAAGGARKEAVKGASTAASASAAVPSTASTEGGQAFVGTKRRRGGEEEEEEEDVDGGVALPPARPAAATKPQAVPRLSASARAAAAAAAAYKAAHPHGRGAGAGRGLDHTGEPKFVDMHPSWQAKRRLQRQQTKTVSKALRKGPEAVQVVVPLEGGAGEEGEGEGAEQV